MRVSSLCCVMLYFSIIVSAVNGCLRSDPIFAIKIMVEEYFGKAKKIYVIFIDLEKA